MKPRIQHLNISTASIIYGHPDSPDDSRPKRPRKPKHDRPTGGSLGTFINPLRKSLKK